jgi:hypothetical protein
VRRFLIAIFALSVLAAATTRARADDDRVSFFHNITVSEGEEAQDAVCVLCSIRVDGELRGSAVAFLGSIRANGIIDKDVVTFLGNVSLGNDARIDGDCVTFLGSVNHQRSSQIGKDLVQFPMVLILVPLFILFFIVYVIRSLVWRARIPYPMPPPPPPPPMR